MIAHAAPLPCAWRPAAHICIPVALAYWAPVATTRACPHPRLTSARADDVAILRMMMMNGQGGMQQLQQMPSLMINANGQVQ